MITMEMLGKIRRMHLREKLSLHEIARRTGRVPQHRPSLAAQARSQGGAEIPAPPLSSPSSPRSTTRSVLALKADAQRPQHERRTAKALLAQLRANGYSGCYSQLTKYIREWRAQEGKAPKAFGAAAIRAGRGLPV